MANLTITNVDRGSVELWNGDFQNELLVFTASGTVAEGTILARKTVATAITATADAGNTGDGTCTAVSVLAGNIVPVAGDWNLECITAVTNGGVFKLEDPAGALISNTLTMTAGAGAATVFEVAGMTFTLTDGATDFAAGDLFTLDVAEDGKMYPYTTDGIGGQQIPLMVLTYDVTAAGAGNEAIRPMISGKVIQERLIIDADGSAVNITAAIRDQLRDFTIVSQSVPDISVLDNQ
jgi:hypothetical protein